MRRQRVVQRYRRRPQNSTANSLAFKERTTTGNDMNYIRKTKTALWKQIQLAKDIGDAFPDGYEPTSSKPIKSRTSKRAKEEAQYRKRVKEWIKGKKCNLWSCNNKATECHHQFGRIGSLLLREDLWIPLCEEHHRKVHSEPDWARSEGLLCPKGMFNSNPKQ